MPHAPGHQAPDPNVDITGGGGGGGFRNFGGFRFGSRFGSLGNPDLTRLTGILGGIPNLFDLTGGQGNNIFRNGTIRAPGLRRLLGTGTITGSDADFINSILGNLGPGPGFSGVDADGNFILGQGLAGLLSDREINRLNSILSQRPNKVADAFKGGRVNFPDLRRLFNALSEGTPAKDFIREILVRSREAGIDDVSNPEAGPEGITPGGGGGEGGAGGGGGQVPGGLLGELDKLLRKLAAGEGFPDEVLRANRNRIRGDSKQALRDNLLRAEERLAARGLSDSGLGERAFEDIEDFNLNARNERLESLALEDARVANANRHAAISGILGLEGLNLDRFLGEEGIRLGERGLDLQELAILIDAALRELGINLGLGGLLGFGSEGGSSLAPSGAGILAGLLGGNDRSDVFAI